MAPKETTQRWKPNVTVATLVERPHNSVHKQYLLVYEDCGGQHLYNQPAGHLEQGESLVNAAIRETREETGWQVEISGLIGIYRFVAPNGLTYLRHAFTAKPLHHDATQTLDEGIIDAVWLSYEEIVEKNQWMRSPLVKQTIDDYLSDAIYPLSLLHESS